MWLPIALIGYFLFAAVKLTDRYLLKSSLPVPIGYAFYVGLFSILGSLIILFLSPLFLGLPFPTGILTVVQLLVDVDLIIILIALLSGVLFIWALISFYYAVKEGEASRVVPAIGASVAVFVFILARFLVDEHLGINEVFAFFFLVIGGVLVSLRITGRSLHFNKRELQFIFFSGFLFALSWVLKKVVFIDQNFVIGFLWMNLGMFAGAMFLLVSSYAREEIFSRPAKVPANKIAIFLLNQGAGGVASVFQNLAVALGSVTIVNGLQGVENFFLLVIAFILAVRFPKILKEEFHGFVVWQKLGAVALISIGLFILSVNVL